MTIEKLLNVPIQALQNLVFTPVLMLVAIFSFIFLLVLYHWSGLAEKVENLSPGKKTIVFIFVALVISACYYIFYKAGKFDKLLNYPLVDNWVSEAAVFLNSIIRGL